MLTLAFTVTFHTAYAVDQQADMPGTVMKGLMLDATRDLGLPWPVIRSVFGGHDHDVALDPAHDLEGTTSWSAGPTLPSPWAWSDVTVAEPALTRRSRIRIDPDTGAVADGAIVQVNEFGGADSALLTGDFTIEQTGPVPARDDPAHLSEADHLAVLEASARTVLALGGDRRRGLGWVSVTRTDAGATSESGLKQLAERIEQLRGMR